MLAGDQAFDFGGAFGASNVSFGNNAGQGVAGQLRAYWTAPGQVIEGDVNGDRKADFSIEIYDPTHAITLSGVDGVDFIH